DAYVPYVQSQFEYCEDLSQRLLGREVRQILLLHANVINAERFDEMARMIEGRGYSFVTLEHALEDKAYAARDDYARPHGVGWLQRWALNRGCGEDFLRGEPTTPRFVQAMSGEGPEGRFVRWMSRIQHARRRIQGTRAAA